MGLTCVLFSTRFEDTDPPVELLHLRVPLRGHDAPQEVLVVEAVSPAGFKEYFKYCEVRDLTVSILFVDCRLFYLPDYNAYFS